jgi:hypothetical protein
MKVTIPGSPGITSPANNYNSHSHNQVAQSAENELEINFHLWTYLYVFAVSKHFKNGEKIKYEFLPD